LEWSGVLTGVVVAVRRLTVCRVILYIPGCMARYFLPAAAAAAALGYIHCRPLGEGEICMRRQSVRPRVHHA